MDEAADSTTNFIEQLGGDAITIEEVVALRQEEGFGQQGMVKEGGADGIPLAYYLLDVGIDLLPMICGAIWAANPGAKDTEG